MSEDRVGQDTLLRLRQLIEAGELPRADRFLAEQCHRRLEQPLRLAVFGTDPRHAISLINLMMGQSVIAPSIERVRVQFLYGETAYARVQHRDGSQQRLEGAEFRQLFDRDPIRVRVYVDLPVLKKLSIMVAAEKDAKALCVDAEKSLPAADIAIWAGNALEPSMIEIWESVPQLLRDHSYLVLSPRMDDSSWSVIADDFVAMFRVDPRRAQEAKMREGGIDKAAFRDAGGAHLIKTIKKEIDLLVQTAVDGGEVLLARYADQLGHVVDEDDTLGLDADVTDAPDEAEVSASDNEKLSDNPQGDAAETNSEQVPSRDQVYSVPLGKVASRSRLLGIPSITANPKITQRTVSLAMKNMPKKVTRPVSTTSTKVRVRSRRSRPEATPWSLGL